MMAGTVLHSSGRKYEAERQWGLPPLRIRCAEGTRELDENVNEGKSGSQRRGRADHDDPSVTLPANSSV